MGKLDWSRTHYQAAHTALGHRPSISISHLSQAYDPEKTHVGYVIYTRKGQFRWCDENIGYRGETFYVVILDTERPEFKGAFKENGQARNHSVKMIMKEFGENCCSVGGFSVVQGILKFSSRWMNTTSSAEYGWVSDGSHFLSSPEQALVQYIVLQWQKLGPNVLLEIPDSLDQRLITAECKVLQSPPRPAGVKAAPVPGPWDEELRDCHSAASPSGSSPEREPSPSKQLSSSNLELQDNVHGWLLKVKSVGVRERSVARSNWRYFTLDFKQRVFYYTHWKVRLGSKKVSHPVRFDDILRARMISNSAQQIPKAHPYDFFGVKEAFVFSVEIRTEPMDNVAEKWLMTKTADDAQRWIAALNGASSYAAAFCGTPSPSPTQSQVSKHDSKNRDDQVVDQLKVENEVLRKQLAYWQRRNDVLVMENARKHVPVLDLQRQDSPVKLQQSPQVHEEHSHEAQTTEQLPLDAKSLYRELLKAHSRDGKQPTAFYITPVVEETDDVDHIGCQDAVAHASDAAAASHAEVSCWAGVCRRWLPCGSGSGGPQSQMKQSSHAASATVETDHV